eukprot:3826492-Prymnesium_polylepis.1
MCIRDRGNRRRPPGQRATSSRPVSRADHAMRLTVDGATRASGLPGIQHACSRNVPPERANWGVRTVTPPRIKPPWLVRA